MWQLLAAVLLTASDVARTEVTVRVENWTGCAVRVQVMQRDAVAAVVLRGECPDGHRTGSGAFHDRSPGISHHWDRLSVLAVHGRAVEPFRDVARAAASQPPDPFVSAPLSIAALSVEG
jgi:hypothetical protein